jgi:hypothetical protein
MWFILLKKKRPDLLSGRFMCFYLLSMLHKVAPDSFAAGNNNCGNN